MKTKTIVYIHSNKESMYDDGIEMGLSDEAAQNFMYCCYEVAVEVEVDETGNYTILSMKEAQ
jgi:hypothetical protein